MQGLKERALAEGIVGKDDWDKIVQHGCTHFVEGILRLLDLHERRPDALPPQRSPATERSEWNDTISRKADSLDLEDVDRVQPGKTFMPPPEITVNIPEVLLPFLNRILADKDYRLPANY